MKFGMNMTFGIERGAKRVRGRDDSRPVMLSRTSRATHTLIIYTFIGRTETGVRRLIRACRLEVL